MEAVVMACNAHQLGGKVQALERSSSETVSKLAEVWYEWFGFAETDTALQVVSSRKAHRGGKSSVTQDGRRLSDTPKCPDSRQK